MSIYNVDFDQVSYELYPTHKRLTNLLGKIYSLCKPLNDLNVFFGFFRDGGTFTAYSGATTYTFGQYVQYQRRIYYRNEVTEGYTAGINPLNTTYWTIILESFIGANERVKFGPNKLVFEYALNKIFGTTFRNPSVGTSDIYIENLSVTNLDAFYVYATDEETNWVAVTDETPYAVPELDPSISNQADFKIWVPIAVYNALASTNTERTAIVTSVANKYKLVGFNFEIDTY